MHSRRYLSNLLARFVIYVLKRNVSYPKIFWSVMNVECNFVKKSETIAYYMSAWYFYAIPEKYIYEFIYISVSSSVPSICSSFRLLICL